MMRMRRIGVCGCLLLVAMVALFSGRAWGADAAHGEIVARVRCSTCHFLDREGNKIGPSLWDVYDRAPSISGIPFARWDARALDLWMSGPRKVKANTTMMLPPLPQRDREDVIAFLKQQRLKFSGAVSVSPSSP